MLHTADSGRHSHSSRVDGDMNTRVKLLSVFRRAELMCWSLYIRLYGVRWWDNGTGGIRSIFHATVVELNACSTAHQISSLYVVRRHVPLSVLMLLVGDMAGSNSIHLLVPSPLLYDVFDHVSLPSIVTRRSLEFCLPIWRCYARLRRHQFISRSCRHCSSLTSSGNAPYCIVLLTDIWTLFLC